MRDPVSESTNGESDRDLDEPERPGAPDGTPSQAEGGRDQADLPPGADTTEG
jgi:hypothetical protein